MPRWLRLSLVSLITVSCDSSVRSGGPAAPTASAPTVPTTPSGATPSANVAGKIKLVGDISTLYVGRQLTFLITATDTAGSPVDAALAEVTSSDPSVAVISNPITFTIRYNSGATASGVQVSVTLSALGSATIRARLGAATDSVVVKVQVDPGVSKALVVDSFTVVEYRASCAWDCPYLVYAPLLRMREPTGTDSAAVIGVQFDIPGFSTRLCSGRMAFGPGVSNPLNRIDPYLWNNNLIFVRLDGVPIADGPASARVFVQDSKGTIGVIRATGSIQRGVVNPVLPTPVSNIEVWTC